MPRKNVKRSRSVKRAGECPGGEDEQSTPRPSDPLDAVREAIDEYADHFARRQTCENAPCLGAYGERLNEVSYERRRPPASVSRTAGMRESSSDGGSGGAGGQLCETLVPDADGPLVGHDSGSSRAALRSPLWDQLDELDVEMLASINNVDNFVPLLLDDDGEVTTLLDHARAVGSGGVVHDGARHVCAPASPYRQPGSSAVSVPSSKRHRVECVQEGVSRDSVYDSDPDVEYRGPISSDLEAVQCDPTSYSSRRSVENLERRESRSVGDGHDRRRSRSPSGDVSMGTVACRLDSDAEHVPDVSGSGVRGSAHRGDGQTDSSDSLDVPSDHGDGLVSRPFAHLHGDRVSSNQDRSGDRSGGSHGILHDPVDGGDGDGAEHPHDGDSIFRGPGWLGFRETLNPDSCCPRIPGDTADYGLAGGVRDGFSLRSLISMWTFPQCLTDPEDVLNAILERFKVYQPSVVVARELHKDGHPHLHAFVMLKNRPNIRGKATINQMAGLKPDGSPYVANVVLPESSALGHRTRMLEYLLKPEKGGVWIANFDAEQQLKDWQGGVRKPFDYAAQRLFSGESFLDLVRDDKLVPVVAKDAMRLRVYSNLVKALRQIDEKRNRWHFEKIQALHQKYADRARQLEQDDPSVYGRIVEMIEEASGTWTLNTGTFYGTKEQRESVLFARITGWIVGNVRTKRSFSQQQLCLSGPTGTFKSSLLRALSEGIVHHWWVYPTTSGANNYQNGVNDETDIIYMDEFGGQEGLVPTQLLLQLLDGTGIQLNQKYGDMVTVPNGLPVVMVCNIPYQQWYERSDEFIRKAVRRRLLWTNVIESLEPLATQLKEALSPTETAMTETLTNNPDGGTLELE